MTVLAEKPRISRLYFMGWLVEVPGGQSKQYRYWKEALAAVHRWHACGELPPLKHLWWGDAVPRAECVVNDCSYCTFTTNDVYSRVHEACNPGHYVVVRSMVETEPTP